MGGGEKILRNSQTKFMFTHSISKFNFKTKTNADEGVPVLAYLYDRKVVLMS